MAHLIHYDVNCSWSMSTLFMVIPKSIYIDSRSQPKVSPYWWSKFCVLGKCFHPWLKLVVFHNFQSNFQPIDVVQESVKPSENGIFPETAFQVWGSPFSMGPVKMANSEKLSLKFEDHHFPFTVDISQKKRKKRKKKMILWTYLNQENKSLFIYKYSISDIVS